MAKAPTQPTRSIKDNITVNLHSKLTKFQSDQAVVVASNRQNNLAAIKAITAVSRAKTDTTYRNTITPETLKIYANAIETYASKNHIKPTGEDGKFSDEQKEQEFTPEKMISFFSEELYKTNKENCSETKNQILENIKEVYPDEDGKSTVPNEINTATNISPNILLSMVKDGDMSAEEAVERCEDPADKITLTNLLEEQTGNNQKDLEKNAGRADTMRDPDWGHDKGDDDFKIQDGDIIQYLMKEVILASAAWAANKASGIAGTIILETGADIYNECLPGFRKARNKIDEGLEKGKENLKKSIKNFFKGSSLNDEEIKKRGDILTNLLKECSENKTKPKSLLIKDEICGANKQPGPILRKIEKHYLVLENDHVLFPCNEGENINDPKRKKSYKDFDLTTNEEEAKLYAKILGKNLEDFTSKTVNGKCLYTIGGKDYLKYLQKTFDGQTLDGMTYALPNENPEDIKKWLDEYHQKTEEAVKTNNISEVEKMRNEKPSYYIAYTYGKDISRYKAQTEIFSETYTQFMIIEEFRKNPKTDILSDPEKAKEFMDRSRLEAKAIFHSKHKERLDPNKSVPSIAFMIDQMNGLVSESKEALDKGSKEKIENPYDKQKPKSKKESLSIIKAAEDTSVYDFLQGVKNDLDREDQELISKYSENSEKRNKVKEMKERLSQKDKDFKKENPNINMQQYNISGGRKV